jgi:ubiquinone/menaquinone biosynthesis C-methylase UbiE
MEAHISMIERILEPEVMDTAEEAAEYDAMDHTGANEALVQRLIDLGAGGHMLDIGTGPGHIPFLICERLPEAHVTGIDLAEHMLGYARQKLAASPHQGRVRFDSADAKQLNYPDQSFDVVFSNTILHHIPDPEPFLKEALRVLRPGGVLLIRDLFRPESTKRIAELVQCYAAEESPSSQELFRASLHAALTSDELRQVADQAGMQSADLVVDSDRHHSLQISAS